MAYYQSRNPAPAPPKKQVLALQHLLGADLTTSPSAVSTSRSPECPNMVRSTPGKVKKRAGFYFKEQYPAAINGRYFLGGRYLTHAGGSLYSGTTLITDKLNNAHSTGCYFAGRLYLLDGQQFWAVMCENNVYTIQPVSGIAYLPRIVINKNPNGSGGTSFEAVNLLQNKWQESFYVGAAASSATAFQLTFGDLDLTPVTVKVLNPDGVTYTSKTEGTHFTVERTTGRVNFNAAPGQSPVNGQDNVFITASKNRSPQTEKITKANVCTTYGEHAGGARLFVTGNPAYKNRDFYSAMNDPTYFSDLDYSILGQDNEKIVGYSVVGGQLATHKGPAENTVYLRQGSILSEADETGAVKETFVFTTGSVLNGPGAIAQGSFASLGGEPLFLTGSGIYALTSQDITGERYQQQRSYFLNGRLLQEANLAGAKACLFEDFYVLAVNGTLYLLDGLQKSYSKDMPYSAYQYEGYYFTGVPAHTLWVEDGALHFGTENGQVCAFGRGGASLYTDTPAPGQNNFVEARWCTPYLSGSLFYKNKHFSRLSVQLAAGANTGFKAYNKKGPLKQLLIDATAAGRYFTWGNVYFPRFTFSADKTPQIVTRKIKIKKTDKVMLCLENNEINQSFGLEGFALEFAQSGNYKG